MKPFSLDVIYEDNHVLAVNKPAGLPTMGVAPDEPSLLALAKQYIQKKYQKPGNVYLGIVSRLDAPVTGVLLIARTSKAARRLSDQFRLREVEKTYWALVQPPPSPESGKWIDWLRKDERHRKVLLCGQHDEQAQRAVLTYRTLAVLSGRIAHLEVALETGRKHQIRVQMAAHRSPILGDLKYGSRAQFASGIALHARRLRCLHPVRQTRMEFTAPVPSPWRAYLP